MTKKLEVIPYLPEDSFGRSLLSPPRPARLSIPQWLRDQPGKYEVDVPEKLAEHYQNRSPGLTVKRCMPFFDVISQDFVVVTNFDVAVTRLPDHSQMIQPLPDNAKQKTLAFPDEVQGHPRMQFDHLPLPKEFSQDSAPKWIFRYGLKTPKGYSIIFHHPHNRIDLPFYTLSGMVDVDTYNHPVNFPFVIKKDFFGIIPKGTPVVQFSIVKRDSWETVNKKFSLKTIDKFNEEFKNANDNHYKKHYRDLESRRKQ